MVHWHGKKDNKGLACVRCGQRSPNSKCFPLVLIFLGEQLILWLTNECKRYACELVIDSEWLDVCPTFCGHILGLIVRTWMYYIACGFSLKKISMLSVAETINRSSFYRGRAIA
jgi:hypothetical protein